MLVDENSLEEVANLAVQAKANGKQFICVEIVPTVQLSRFVYLWDGIVGRVTGRRYVEERAPKTERNADVVTPKTVERVTLQVSVQDVIEAMRRHVQRGTTAPNAAKLKVNRIRRVRVPGTNR